MTTIAHKTPWGTTTCPRHHHNNNNKTMIVQYRQEQLRTTTTSNNNMMKQKTRAKGRRTFKSPRWMDMGCHELGREQIQWNSCAYNMQWWITSHLHSAPDLRELHSMKSNTSGETFRFSGQELTAMGLER